MGDRLVVDRLDGDGHGHLCRTAGPIRRHEGEGVRTMVILIGRIGPRGARSRQGAIERAAHHGILEVIPICIGGVQRNADVGVFLRCDLL